ncbi:hypothetical protein AQUCO_03600069v1 [Aquilegia coerulea]|uniref:Small ribosomal subunit protein bS20c n=1 Tax=Aquilegia coerulea TaxID=218851 RepID=A0A2G5CV52_AQUCA|nr:hypothetical protein AQUCO_03600069v1 [Aquilegia coerulea]
MASIQCVSSCISLRKQFPSINCSKTSNFIAHSTTTSYLKTLSFSRNVSETIFSNGSLTMKVVERPNRRSVVCEATPTTKKPDSAAKRARQAEKRRIYNKSKKSELKTRMKKVLDSLDVLKKKKDAQSEEILSIEKLIAEAYSAIDKAVKAGALHRNTGANRKSRLARRKKTVEILKGWYTPASSLKV